MPKFISPPHPGETILEDILKPLDMSVNHLARCLGITASRLNEIVRGRRGITADTALRLAQYLARPPSSGWDCNWSMTSESPGKKPERELRAR